MVLHSKYAPEEENQIRLLLICKGVFGAAKELCLRDK